MATTFQAMQGAQIGPHQLGVPGRHEAGALTDCCPRSGCLRPVQPAAVLDEVHGGKVTGRYAAYRCPGCDAAWLCWWGASMGRNQTSAAAPAAAEPTKEYLHVSRKTGQRYERARKGITPR